MFKICCRRDLELLADRTVLPPVAEFVTERFWQLFAALRGPGDTKDSFSLAELGGLVVLADGDDPVDLVSVGYESSDLGLVGTRPESLVQYSDSGGPLFIHAAIVHNSSFVQEVIVPRAVLVRDVRLHRWIARHSTGFVQLLGPDTARIA